ncbi:MAG: hypothetical protein KBA26_07925 [Candidatus Delongbacteria bacterium]|nr:hypothetical protein [Candidatus Delongbacteria bacterium]
MVKTMHFLKQLNMFILGVAVCTILTGVFITISHAQENDSVIAEAPAVPQNKHAKMAEAAPVNESKGINPGLGYIAIALATGFSTIGAGIAVSNVGSAAIGSITEKPELFGRALIFVGLAEGIAIYGLIISIILLTKL